jgi:hypothetical protein
MKRKKERKSKGKLDHKYSMLPTYFKGVVRTEDKMDFLQSVFSHGSDTVLDFSPLFLRWR